MRRRVEQQSGLPRSSRRRRRRGACEREREAEHAAEDEERERQCEQLAAPEVGGELRVEVVLDRRLAGDERRRAARRAKRVAQPLRLAPSARCRLRARFDLAVDDAASCAERAERPARQSTGDAFEPRAKLPLQVLVRRVAHVEDDRERSLRPLAEAAREGCLRPLRAGSGQRRTSSTRCAGRKSETQTPPASTASQPASTSREDARRAGSIRASAGDEEWAASPPGARPTPRRLEKSKSTSSLLAAPPPAGTVRRQRRDCPT